METKPEDVGRFHDVLATIKKIKAREIAFDNLPSDDKAAIVGFLKCQGMMAEELARDLHIPRTKVYYYFEKFTKVRAKVVRETAGQTLGRLFAKAETLYAYAMKDKDYRLAWEIERDLLSVLHKLGMDVVGAPSVADGSEEVPEETLRKQIMADLQVAESIDKKHGRHDGNGTGRAPRLPGPPEERGDEE